MNKVVCLRPKLSFHVLKQFIAEYNRLQFSRNRDIMSKTKTTEMIYSNYIVASRHRVFVKCSVFYKLQSIKLLPTRGTNVKTYFTLCQILLMPHNGDILSFWTSYISLHSFKIRTRRGRCQCQGKANMLSETLKKQPPWQDSFYKVLTDTI